MIKKFIERIRPYPFKNSNHVACKNLSIHGLNSGGILELKTVKDLGSNYSTFNL